ncbi:MAG: tRNA pseudouridine(38-40) synthase TruA [Clostridia bacterium]|nr:tRNA pseudouridine(38-40) synthase TruA [Clostridia bacterium]
MEQKRILLTVSYDGTAYVGWQFQNNGPSIQDELEKALQKALGQFVRVTGASRTDAGVHALGQRAHFDVCSSIPPEKYPFVLNRYLPEDIRVTAAKQVPDDFHARFMAAGKIYTYRIHNAAHASAIFRHCTAHVPVRLDEGNMRECAQALLGTHDFAAFAAAGGQAKTTVRTIDDFSVERAGDEITLRVHGNGFLYNMVRIIAGTLIDVGHGKLDTGCIARAIETKNRLDLGVTAPACGLELTQVEYDFEREEYPHDGRYFASAF